MKEEFFNATATVLFILAVVLLIGGVVKLFFENPMGCLFILSAVGTWFLSYKAVRKA